MVMLSLLFIFSYIIRHKGMERETETERERERERERETIYLETLQT